MHKQTCGRQSTCVYTSFLGPTPSISKATSSILTFTSTQRKIVSLLVDFVFDLKTQDKAQQTGGEQMETCEYTHERSHLKRYPTLTTTATASNQFLTTEHINDDTDDKRHLRHQCNNDQDQEREREHHRATSNRQSISAPPYHSSSHLAHECHRS